MRTWIGRTQVASISLTLGNHSFIPVKQIMFRTLQALYGIRSSEKWPLNVATSHENGITHDIFE